MCVQAPTLLHRCMPCFGDSADARGALRLGRLLQCHQGNQPQLRHRQLGDTGHILQGVIALSTALPVPPERAPYLLLHALAAAGAAAPQYRALVRQLLSTRAVEGAT